MKKSTLVACLLLLLAATAAAQFTVNQASGERRASWVDGAIVPDRGPESGTSIWNNMDLSGYWSNPYIGYINLDWGTLPEPSSGLIAYFPMAMDDDRVGDFCAIDIDLPPQAGVIPFYLQGVLGDVPLLQPPLDASNGLKAN